MKLQVEIWKSDHNREERHYFVVDGLQHGYQGERAYLIGFNPEMISDELEKKILALLGVT